MSTNIKKFTTVSLLSAIIAVLTVICTFIRFGPFSITLALTPIIIGAALYNEKTGAFLGGVFGIIVLFTGLAGWDGGTVNLLISQNAVATVLLCIVKGAAAGYIAGIVYKALSKKNEFLAVVLSAIICPIVNTGLFVLGMYIFFVDTLTAWAGGANVIYYVIFVLTGLNFIVELVTTVVLSSAIKRIIAVAKKM